MLCIIEHLFEKRNLLHLEALAGPSSVGMDNVMQDDAKVAGITVRLRSGSDLPLQVVWEDNALGNVRREIENLIRSGSGVWSAVFQNGRSVTIRVDAIDAVSYHPTKSAVLI